MSGGPMRSRIRRSAPRRGTGSGPASVAAAATFGVAALSLPLESAAAGSLSIQDDSFAAVRGVGQEIDVLANDVLGDRAAESRISITLVTAPATGVATVEDADGDGPALPVIRYVASAGSALGPVTFEYTVLAGGVELGSALVTGSVENRAPVANPDAATVASARGVTVRIPVLANDVDPDGDALKLTSVGSPEHGTATIDGDVISYDPVDGYVGPDRFGYTITDDHGTRASGSVDLTVVDATKPMRLRNDSLRAVSGKAVLVDVLANDDDGGRGPLAVVAAGPARSRAIVSVGKDARSIRYQSARSFSGSDQLTYRVRDRFGNEAAARVDVQVSKPPAVKVQISVSGPLTRAAVPFSYRPGCPVRPASLRRMTMNYWDYSGKLRRGSLIVRRDAVSDMRYVFTRAFDARFPLKSLIPADAFYDKGRRSPTSSDRAAMAAGNTSAFNCRPVVGNPTKRSTHSYGVAIDINTFENPYVVGKTFYPRKAGAYLKRTPCRQGMICPRGVVATSMKHRGWLWGARWAKPDYQHFSSTGG